MMEIMLEKVSLFGGKDLRAMYRRFLKRLLDILLGSLVLLLLWPVILLAMLAIYIEDPGPVIFRQALSNARLPS